MQCMGSALGRLGSGIPAGRRLSAWASAVLLSVSGAFAQKPQVETFNVGAGLPSPAVTDLGQDPEGRLWVLTLAGVTVYDGDRFAEVTNDGLPGDELGAFEVDANGRAWAVTRWTGPDVFRLDGNRWQRLPKPEGADGRDWNSLVVTARGTDVELAVGSTYGGLWLWDGGAWRDFGGASGLPSDKIRALAAVGESIAIGTNAGLCFLTGGELDCSIREREARLEETILGLSADASRLWVLGTDWLGSFEDGRLLLLAEGFVLPSLLTDTRGAVLADAVGGLYFGTQQRLLFRDPDTGAISPLGLSQGLATEGVTGLLRDREANVWVSSVRGLSKVESRRFLSFDRGAGLLEDEVTAIHEPLPGELVLGHNLGLTFLGEEGVETLPFERRPTDPIDAFRVMDMAADGEGGLWLAVHRRGLLRLGADRRLEARSPASRVFSVEVDSRGTVWTCGSGRLFADHGEGFSEVETGFDDLKSFRWIAAGDDGSIYVSTTEGLLWRDGDRWRLARGPTSESDWLYGLLPEPGGGVWVGTRAGLFRLSGNALDKVREPGPAIDHPVYLIVRDDDGQHWFGSDDGVRVWDGRQLRHLSVRHGLAGWETNRSAGWVDHRGRVWIGTDRGVSMYQKRYDSPPAVPPKVTIHSLELDGEQLALDGDVRLGHRQNTLLFHLSTIAFSRRESVRYRYRLEGFENAWQGPVALPPSGIRYTNVPPGRYRMRVAAAWADGPWSDEATSPVIAIARPFWRRAWFYVLVTCGLGLAVLGAHGLRTRAIRARNRELEALTVELAASIADRQRLIDDLEDKNRELERFTYTVSHDLKSPLVTIKGFLGLLEQDAATGDVERTRHDVERIAAATATMGRLLDELLELSRIGRVVNEPETVPFAELAREAVDSVAGALAERGVEVDVDPGLPAVRGDRVRLLEVLQNLVENGAKFMGDQPSPRIEIGSRQDGSETVFYVRDNGIGIDPRYQEKVFVLFERLDQEIAGTGVGLTLVQRIVEIHGGRIWVESEGEGQGTAFCFTLIS